MNDSSSPLLGCLCILIVLGAVFWSVIGAKFWRKYRINSHASEWSKDTCRMLIDRRIGIGMTPEMVRLSLGSPSKIDDVEVTANSRKERWIYGKRGNAAYIWFTNGQVAKIKQ